MKPARTAEIQERKQGSQALHILVAKSQNKTSRQIRGTAVMKAAYATGVESSVKVVISGVIRTIMSSYLSLASQITHYKGFYAGLF